MFRLLEKYGISNEVAMASAVVIGAFMYYVFVSESSVLAENYDNNANVVNPVAPIVAKPQPAKVTVLSTNLSLQRRGLLPPVMRGGQTRDSKNISTDIRAASVLKPSNEQTHQFQWNASDIAPEHINVPNRYI